MKELSEQLLRLVETAEPKLHSTSEPETARPLLPGGWSRKQVLGHLIDSASNNHQRFVRAALQPSLDFPAYDQDETYVCKPLKRPIGPCWSRCGPPTIAISPT
jgi:hypothetical protein